jgi:choice-of-anchor B domain-containing protein
MASLVILLGALFLQGGVANPELMRVINIQSGLLKERGFFRDTMTRDSILGQPQSCVNGKVTLDGEDFPCNNIDFYSFLAMKDLEISSPPHREEVGERTTDIWGMLMPSGREFTLLALDNGATVIDSTDPTRPCIIAKMPTGRIPDRWGDIKVYKNVMYHVKDANIRDTSDNPLALPDNAEYGVEVFDLLPLDQVDCSVDGYEPFNLRANTVFRGHGRSHNLEINTLTGRLYSVGSEKCGGGPVILDVKTDPLNPVQIGCIDQDGYTHDLQCIIYDGPDVRFTDREICFAFNEDTLTIWDFTDLVGDGSGDGAIMISRTPYPNQVYSHQGWVNDDLTKVLLDDELDEVCNQNILGSRRCETANELSGELRTTTNVFNIINLEFPIFEGAYTHPEQSIDHNLYVWGRVHRTGQGGNPPMEFYPDPNYAYMNNYLAGLKIVDIRDNDIRNWFEAGTFDFTPEITEIIFGGGVWSGYMHPSGVYAASVIDRGLFLVQPNMAFTEDFPQAPFVDPGTNPDPTDPDPVDPTEPTEPAEESSGDNRDALLTLVVFFFLAIVVVAAFRYSQRRPKKSETMQGSRVASSVKPSRAEPSGVVSMQNPMHSEHEA